MKDSPPQPALAARWSIRKARGRGLVGKDDCWIEPVSPVGRCAPFRHAARGSSVFSVEVLYECFSKTLVTGQAATLQPGEVLDDFRAIAAFSGLAHRACNFMGMFVQVFEQFRIRAEPVEDEFSFRQRWFCVAGNFLGDLGYQDPVFF